MLEFKNKQEFDKECHLCKIIFLVCLISSVGLLVASFILPPAGVIHPSVLQAIGELFFYPALAAGMYALRLGRSAKVKIGKADVTLGDVKKDEEEETQESDE